MSRFVSETVLVAIISIVIVLTFVVLIIDDKMSDKKNKQ